MMQIIIKELNKFYLKRLVVLAGYEDTTSSLLSMRDHLAAFVLCCPRTRSDVRLGGFAARLASWAAFLSSLSFADSSRRGRPGPRLVAVSGWAPTACSWLASSCVFVSGCGLTAGCSFVACCASASLL
jgi:hypothetical protein